MDRIIEEFKKLHEDYEKLRVKYIQRTHESEIMESTKNDKIDNLTTEINCLKSELTEYKERTTYLCCKRKNQNGTPHHNPSSLREAEFLHEWRGGKSYCGRPQKQRGQCHKNGRY